MGPRLGHQPRRVACEKHQECDHFSVSISAAPCAWIYPLEAPCMFKGMFHTHMSFTYMILYCTHTCIHMLPHVTDLRGSLL